MDMVKKIFLVSVFVILSSCRYVDKGGDRANLKVRTQDISFELVDAACDLNSYASLKELLNRCKDSPVIEDARLVKKQGDTPVLYVKGVKKAMYIVADDGVFFVSDTGKVLSQYSGGIVYDFPIFFMNYVNHTDPNFKVLVKRAFDVMDFIKGHVPFKVKGVGYRPYAGFEVDVASPAMRIVLGESGVKDKLMHIQAVIRRIWQKVAFPARVVFVDSGKKGELTAVIRGRYE